MAGTPEGGAAAAAKNKALYGEDYYERIGSIGGRKPTKEPKGFAYAKLHLTPADPGHPANAGKKGGWKSRRTKG